MIKLVSFVKILLKLSILFFFIAFSFSVGMFLHALEILSIPHTFFEISLDIVNSSAPFIILIALLLFIVGLIKYIIFKHSKEVDQQKRSEIKKTILGTGIAFSLIVVAWYTTAFVSAIFSPTIDKPVIYLYPGQEQEISVQLDYQGKIIAEYPEYNEEIKGWEVTAYSDGQIINHADNQEYSYLFWEGKPNKQIDWNLSKGFIVRGEDTREFLQQTLSEIGLTPKEYNEFIVYWYPLMKDNPYNIIHFAGKQYTQTAPLTITPKPDSMLRVFMVFKPINKKIEIESQIIQPFERKGFTVVEWGGTEIR